MLAGHLTGDGGVVTFPWGLHAKHERTLSHIQGEWDKEAVARELHLLTQPSVCLFPLQPKQSRSVARPSSRVPAASTASSAASAATALRTVLTAATRRTAVSSGSVGVVTLALLCLLGCLTLLSVFLTVRCLGFPCCHPHHVL